MRLSADCCAISHLSSRLSRRRSPTNAQRLRVQRSNLNVEVRRCEPNEPFEPLNPVNPLNPMILSVRYASCSIEQGVSCRPHFPAIFREIGIRSPFSATASRGDLLSAGGL